MPKPINYYSVYDRRTDEPVAIHRTALECVKILGITLNTFYIYVTRSNKGVKKRKYDIYVDDPEEEDADESSWNPAV